MNLLFNKWFVNSISLKCVSSGIDPWTKVFVEGCQGIEKKDINTTFEQIAFENNRRCLSVIQLSLKSDDTRYCLITACTWLDKRSPVRRNHVVYRIIMFLTLDMRLFQAFLCWIFFLFSVWFVNGMIYSSVFCCGRCFDYFCYRRQTLYCMYINSSNTLVLVASIQSRFNLWW